MPHAGKPPASELPQHVPAERQQSQRHDDGGEAVGGGDVPFLVGRAPGIQCAFHRDLRVDRAGADRGLRGRIKMISL